MNYEIISENDIEEIKALRPQGWADISHNILYYTKHDFCRPIKIIEDSKIVGIGCSIIFNKSAWLAHIIVKEEYRNRGIGSTIVQHLINYVQSQKVATISLIATALGEPIYKKAGFTPVCDYIFLKRETPWVDGNTSSNIVSYSSDFHDQIITLDREISGENRASLIECFITDSVLYVENNLLEGYYIPTLGDGVIFANSDKAGFELMKIKYRNIDNASIPAPNISAIHFLKEHGFVHLEYRGKRMIIGESINWLPEKVFSRIGGNFG